MTYYPLIISPGLNDFLDPQACSVKYTSFDKVIEMIAKQGVNARLANIDIKSAFRLLSWGFLFVGLSV